MQTVADFLGDATIATLARTVGPVDECDAIDSKLDRWLPRRQTVDVAKRADLAQNGDGSELVAGLEMRLCQGRPDRRRSRSDPCVPLYCLLKLVEFFSVQLGLGGQEPDGFLLPAGTCRTPIK